ncbi:MAG: type IX secretion system sortase PorU [Candidatus Cyclobacteriaceae bacterium M3_2C_046]
MPGGRNCRYLLFLLILFADLTHTVAAEVTPKYSVDWQGYKILLLPSGQQRQVLDHNNAIHTAANHFLPAYRLYFDRKVDSVQVIPLLTVPLTETEQAQLEWHLAYPVQISYFTERSISRSIVDVPTLILDSVSGLPVKVVQFNLRIFSPSPNHPTGVNQRTKNTTNSVLSEGSWYKIGVTKDGIYKLTAGFLRDMGLPLDQLDPRKIQVYGNGGKLLPQLNAAPRIQDLQQNAIFISGESDGSFDNGDYILFYGQGPDLVKYDAGGNLVYQHHYYSDTSYYFLRLGAQEALRIQPRPSVSGQMASVDKFDDIQAYEQDLYNLLQVRTQAGSGREWYGDRFDFNLSKKDYLFDFEGLVPSSTLKITSHVMAASPEPSGFDLRLNGSSLGTQSVDAINARSRYAIKGFNQVDTFKISSSQVDGLDGPLTINLAYDAAGKSGAAGFLNYLILEGQRKLQLYGNQTSFRTLNSKDFDQVQYKLNQLPERAVVWDVTDPLIPVNQSYNNSGNEAVFGVANHKMIQEFIVFNPASELLTPSSSQAIPNQNLRGIAVPDMIVISHASFMEQATRLADFRRSHNQLAVEVVDVEAVYNEFSSGSQDITAIRDFMKHLYNKAPGRLQYLLLFGKCSFDYRNILENNTNFVPTYQSRNSLHPIYSYSSDDYYGFLDPEEGVWEETYEGDHLMDIGVGRLPVTNTTDAKIVVDKLINYARNPATLGDWRKEIFFLADDEDFNTHQRDADLLADFIDQNYPSFNVNKIFLDAFPQETRVIGERSPEAVQAVNNMMDQGALIVNFTGHGNEDQLTEEQLITKVMINQWENGNKLPLFVTATCEFGRYDHPLIQSGAELLLNHPRGGAIGLVTTTRPVFSNTNFQLNRAFYHAAFELIENEQSALGKIFQFTKNNSLSGSVNRNFSLLGDPSMILAYPSQKISLTSITDQDDLVLDTLRALQKIKLKGQVEDYSGEKLSSFGGDLLITIFDKPSQVETLGNKSPRMKFSQRENVIFRGEASVENGVFEVDFVVPKNIFYQWGNAKISLYAYHHDDLLDAAGAESQVKLGGSYQAIQDQTPPQIDVFINDTTFRSGQLAPNQTYLLARLADQSGINISNAGIGQEITAILDQEQEFKLNDFYRSEKDNYQVGWVRFPLRDLTEGEHWLTLKAWDTHNNANQSTISFFVGRAGKFIIKKLLNIPNPFTEQTVLAFEHNRAGESLEVNVQVLSSRGEVIKNVDLDIRNSQSMEKTISWNGRNNGGKKLETGLYIFKITVRSKKDGSVAYKTNRVILIN